MRTDDNLENHMALNAPDAPWNQPDAPEESAAERADREKAEQAAKARAEFCDALVEIAEFLEAQPDCPLPHGFIYRGFYDREEFLAAVKALAKGGKVEKLAESAERAFPRYCALRHFGPIKIEFDIDRTLVCRLVSPAVYDCPDSLLEAGKEFEERK